MTVPPSPDVQSLSPIPTIFDLMNNSMMIKQIPNPYVVDPPPDNPPNPQNFYTDYNYFYPKLITQ